MKTSIRTLAGAALVVLTCAGCSSRLVLSNQPTHGLALPTPIAYVEFVARNLHSKGLDCAAVLEARHITLPGDPQRYVNIEANTFAKAGLVVKYSDRGLVTEVAFNTEPSADAIAAATGAATSLLPFPGARCTRGSRSRTTTFPPAPLAATPTEPATARWC